MNDIELLVHQLNQLDREHPWVEVKVDNYDHTMIGRDISALANSAVYHERDKAYLIWGVADDTHEVVGTKFTPKKEKHGNQELEGWLRILLSKNAEFGFEKGICDGKEVVVLTVYPAVGFTVMFEKTDYIRVGTSTRPLNDYPAMKAQVWNRLSKQSFEVQTARDNLLLHEALELLDYHVYFQRQNKPVPGTEEGIGYYLTEDNILVKQDDGRYYSF